MRIYYFSFLLLFILTGSGCVKDKCLNCNTAYPVEIDKIIVTRCAKSGCHDASSKDAAGGLDLSSWDRMFNGTTTGSAVVPYSARFSPLLYFVNIDSFDGLVGEPTMPLNDAPLSKAKRDRHVEGRGSAGTAASRTTPPARAAEPSVRFAQTG